MLGYKGRWDKLKPPDDFGRGESALGQGASSLMAMRRDAAEAAKKNNDPHFTTEEIAEVLGKDAEEFLSCMVVVEAIIADPKPYMGLRAGVEAVRLAALRTKIGAKAQLYKSNAVGNPDLRKRKDVLMCMYDALLENIQTLKLTAKFGQEIN